MEPKGESSTADYGNVSARPQHATKPADAPPSGADAVPERMGPNPHATV